MQDKISEGIGLSDALPDKIIAKILLHPVLSVLIPYRVCLILKIY